MNKQKIQYSSLLNLKKGVLIYNQNNLGGGAGENQSKYNGKNNFNKKNNNTNNSNN